jgi:hypothetical protein
MRGPTSRIPAAAKATRVYINLGRTGDAIASVPLCWLYYKETGKKAALMVHRQFSSFLEGISYIQPEIWDGDWKDIGSARARARGLGYKEVIVAQIYGYGIKVGRKTGSFITESWHQVGRLGDFGAPLVFDRRNFHREAELAAKLPTGKPIVLVAADGVSSPFAHREELFTSLRQHLGDTANVVDLADYRTPHFHDFIGLFDRACCLVTIDTGFGQLACASKVPVVALAAFQPSTWHSSPRRPQHIAYIRYNEFHQKKKELLHAVSLAVGKFRKPCIHHVWAGIGMGADSLRRHNVAKVTWEREALDYGAWQDCRITENVIKRSAKDLGDPAQLPYIHDMLNIAASRASHDDDVLLLTNADICLIPGVAREIAAKCADAGATYCHRWDFPLVVTHIERGQIDKGRWYIGADLFACTHRWWIANRDQLPPFVLGRECWDWVFRLLIDKRGGGQIEKGIYHEKHASPWEVSRGLAGNVHNRSYARAWLVKNNVPLAEIKDEPHFPVAWKQPAI